MRNMVWVIAAIIAAWFIILTINHNIFSYSNVDSTIQGSIRIADTDIGDQCGTDVNRNDIIEYKLSAQGRIIYLCPVGWWPVQREVVANTLTPAFRKILSPGQLAKINAFYPEPKPEAAPQPTQPQMMEVPAFH